MKGLWLAAGALFVATAFVITGAQAQGVAFNGPYVGLNVGGGTLNDSGLESCISPFTNTVNGTGCVVPSAIGGQLSGSGFIGGAQAGYNVPVPMWSVPMVIGAEFDMQGTTISGSSSKTINPTPFVGLGNLATTTTFTASQQIQWLSTLRARLGYAGFDRFLIYGTAGVAFAQVKETSQSIGLLNSSQSADSIKAGPTIGGGVEYAISDRLTVKGEGLYYNLGTETVYAPNVGLAAGQTGKEFRTSGAIFRIGLNWQFGVAPQPAPATPVAAAAPPPPAPAPAPGPRKFIVYFDFDKASLTADGQKVVDSAAAYYKQGGHTQIQIAGYTDLSGSAAYDQKLSQRRAETVKAALVKDGVPATAIDARAYGKTNPRVPTADGVREPQNRRVEITE